MKRLFLLCALAVWCLPVHGQKVATVFFEDFDSATSPDDLHGWVVGPEWRIDQMTPSNGSGINSLGVYGAPGEPGITRSIDLRRLMDGSFSYRVRKTNSFADSSIVITASIDGGITFPVMIADLDEALENVSTQWRLKEFELPEVLIGRPDVRFPIENIQGGPASGSARFDDFMVSGHVQFDIEPPGGMLAAPPGEFDQQTFTLTNYNVVPLTIDPPQLSAPGFSVEPSGSVTIQPEEEQVYVITFAPEADGVVEAELHVGAGSAGAMTIPLLGLTTFNQVSFSRETSTAGASETAIPVDLNLSFTDSEEDLNAVEISISWDDPVIELADVLAGPDISGNGWTLTYESGAQNAKVLFYNSSGSGLSRQHYDPILTLAFNAGLVSETFDVEISIDDVIGALAVPTADDASLIVKQGRHYLSIERRDATFVIDEEEIDFGTIEADELAEATFTISNPGSDRRLWISEMEFTGGPFVVEPSSAFVEVDEAVTFTVTYAPTYTDFGLADGVLNISHDGDTLGVHALPVRGLAVHGRGDNDGDGMVDVMDVVNIVDFVLERTGPTPVQVLVSDLYPFPDGDGAFDVRDLSLNVQAIARGIWPDDILLPATYDPVELDPSGSKRLITDAEVRVSAVDEGPQLNLILENEVPLRGLQVHLRIDHILGTPELVLNKSGAPDAAGRAEVDLDQGLLRVILYKADGGAIPAGAYSIATIPRTASGGVAEEYATAVDVDNRRLRVDVAGLAEIGPNGPEVPEQFLVESPYPNPFSHTEASVVKLPVQSSSSTPVRLEIYDVLGRRIDSMDDRVEGRSYLYWSARERSGTPVAPGTYFLRVTTEDTRTVRQVVVVR